jgi:hypothetical protein
MCVVNTFVIADTTALAIIAWSYHTRILKDIERMWCNQSWNHCTYYAKPQHRYMLE